MRPPVWQIHNYITTISVKLDKFQVKSDHPWNAILSERDGYTERAKETARKLAFCSGVFFLLLSNPWKTFWCYLFVNSRRPSASSSQKNIQKKTFFGNSQCWCWWFRWCEGYPGKIPSWLPGNSMRILFIGVSVQKYDNAYPKKKATVSS